MQLKPLINVKFTEEQTKLVDFDIEELLYKDVIVPCVCVDGEFCFPNFYLPSVGWNPATDFGPEIT